MARLKPSKPLEPVKLKVKKGDTVEIISGKDKGKRGKVLQAMPKDNKVLVEDANKIIRHTKDRPNRNPGANPADNVIKGGRIEKESPLFVAKVMVVIAGTAADLSRFLFQNRDHRMVRQPFALDAEVVDIVAKPVFHESVSVVSLS